MSQDFFLCPSSTISHFSKEPCFLYSKMVRNQDLLGVFIALDVISHKAPQWTGLGSINIHIDMHKHVYAHKHTFLLRYNSHPIKSTPLNKWTNLVVFSIFKRLWKHHHYLILERFHHFKKKNPVSIISLSSSLLSALDSHWTFCLYGFASFYCCLLI